MAHAKTESVPLTAMAERGCGGWVVFVGRVPEICLGKNDGKIHHFDSWVNQRTKERTLPFVVDLPRYLSIVM